MDRRLVNISVRKTKEVNSGRKSRIFQTEQLLSVCCTRRPEIEALYLRNSLSSRTAFAHRLKEKVTSPDSKSVAGYHRCTQFLHNYDITRARANSCPLIAPASRFAWRSHRCNAVSADRTPRDSISDARSGRDRPGTGRLDPGGPVSLSNSASHSLSRSQKGWIVRTKVRKGKT